MEYAEGYKFEDTVLVGVTCYFNNDGRVSLPVYITEVIAFHRVSGGYFSGLESVASPGCRPTIFPFVHQGSFYPDNEQMALVHNRDPSLALWTSREFPSFPHARGFYARDELVKIVEMADSQIFNPLNYHERKADGTLVGFGLREPLLAMMSKWHEVVKAYVDPKLGTHLLSGDDDPDLRRLAHGLYLLGGKNEEDAFRRILSAEAGISDERILDMMSEDRNKVDLSAVRRRLREFKDKIISQ